MKKAPTPAHVLALEAKELKRLAREKTAALRKAATQRFACVMNDPSLQATYKALKARGKYHTVAMFDIARRLIWRLVAIIKSLPKNYIQSTVQPA